jgi:hypothetical protein
MCKLPVELEVEEVRRVCGGRDRSGRMGPAMSSDNGPEPRAAVGGEQAETGVSSRIGVSGVTLLYIAGSGQFSHRCIPSAPYHPMQRSEN